MSIPAEIIKKDKNRVKRHVDKTLWMEISRDGIYFERITATGFRVYRVEMFDYFRYYEVTDESIRQI